MRGFIHILLLTIPSASFAQLDFEREPILYSQSEPTDRAAQLAERMLSGQTQLNWDSEHGYLKSLLTELQVPQASQTLVFSKTSLQVSRISPQKPRAVYFSDDIYIGWVQHGDLIEVSAADSDLGATFYTLSQKTTQAPLLKRETSRCLQCHGSTHTRRIPGHIVRSVYPDNRGLPVFRLGTYSTNGRLQFGERWGGWYVTGTHGQQRHMGNTFLEDPDADEELDTNSGANVTDLSSLIAVEPYLTPHSDIVALMVLQHQVHMHNVLTAANHAGRLAQRDSQIMNKALDREPGFESESTQRRYESAAEKVLRALLFSKEMPLTDTITGTSDFADEFQRHGPFDDSNRSLRQFDLQTRLFKYPCSFLIYSDAFRALPAGVSRRVSQRLGDVLSGQDTSKEFSHLTAEDRAAISQILAATR